MAKRAAKNTIKEAIEEARLQAKPKAKGEPPQRKGKHRWPRDAELLSVGRKHAVEALVRLCETVPGRMPIAYEGAEDTCAQLVQSLYEVIAKAPQKALAELVRDVSAEKPAADLPGLLGQAKRVIHGTLGFEWDDLKYLDAWRMWPSRSEGDGTVARPARVQQRGRAAHEESDDMASKKKTTKKAATKKKTAVKAEGDGTGRKGKPVGPKLLAPVRKESSRGKLLAAALKKGGADPETLAGELGTTRSSVMSMFFDLNARNGIGYTLADGFVTAELPKGCDDPWAAKAEKPAKTDKPAKPAKAKAKAKGKTKAKKVATAPKESRAAA